MPEIPEAILEVIRAGMKKVKVPSSFDKVYKDECVLSFANPFSEGGLFVSLATWQGYGRDHVCSYAKAAGETLFLHENWTKVPKPRDERPEAQPTKMAIGVEGGFAGLEEFDIEKRHTLAVVSATGEVSSFPLLPNELPTLVSQACDAVIASDGASFKEEVAAWEDTDAQTDSKYANDLVQVPDPPKISSDPSTWVCPESGARDNLWLNLSTGYIGGGRKHHDGSGGSGSALKHFEETGRKYPLAVKLGTITPHGADVYSYAPDEDRSCKDPKLAEHLAHFGIDIMKQEKTVKTTVELNVELNKIGTTGKILESDRELVPVHGPGLQGIQNIGNSCYIASTLQVLAAVQEISSRYHDHKSSILSSCPQGKNPADDVLIQTAKLVSVLCSGELSKEGEDGTNPAYQVRPSMFKFVVGKGHPEFSSSRQQDAQEYLGHLVEQLSRAEKGGGARVAAGPSIESLFSFETTTRTQCDASKQVAYHTSTERMLGLKIPMEHVTNKQEVEEYQERQSKKQKTGTSDEESPVFPIVPFEKLIDRFAAPGTVTDWYSPATKANGTATRQTRFKTFPKYLAVYLQRYYATETWELKKLEVEVPMPEELDLTALKGTSSLQEGEVALPASDAASAPSLQPDPEILAQLLSMGFDDNGCRKACLAVKNASADAAMQWVLDHMGDPDFSAPLPAEGEAAGGEFSEEDIGMLTGLGFTPNQVKKALKATGGNTERAADWLFSHPDVGDEAEDQAPDPSSNVSEAVSDGPGKYSLFGFVSHMGKNTMCGHYVAHIKKDGAWYLYNDEKVLKSEEPPFGHAYMYFYKRNDV